MNTAMQQQQSSGIGPGGNVAQYRQPRRPRSRGENSWLPSDVFEGRYKIPSLSKMEDVSVEVAEDPLNFTCILTKYCKEIDDINDQMGKAYSSWQDYSMPSARVKIGMACVVPFDENNSTQYYRAKVKSINRTEAEVVFVDYGNTRTLPLTDLQYLLKSCADTPETYMQCTFDNVAPAEGNSWGEGALRAFMDYFKDNLLFQCYIKREVNGTNGVYIVELFPHDGNLDQPVSIELERRGVLQCLSESRPSSAASRGRRAHPSRTEPEIKRSSNRSRCGLPPERTQRRRAIEESGPRGRDMEEHTHRGRGDETRNRRRSLSPTSSDVNSDLMRAGFKPPTIVIKGFTDVRVYQPSTPNKFSCQILSDKETLDELYKQLQIFYDEGGDEDCMDDMLPFLPCAVLLDGRWNRGYIHSSSYHGCQVVLVDTQEVVSVDQDQLRWLRREFCNIPAQGVKCSLDGLTCKDSKVWNSEACRFFKDEVSDVDLVAEFRAEKRGLYKIFLHSNVGEVDQMINALLVVKGWAATVDSRVKQAVEDLITASNNIFGMYKVQTGKSFTVVACYVNGPSEFFLHLVDEKQNIQEMQDNIDDYYYGRTSLEKAKFTVDSYCVGLWDEFWYRARIISVSRESCELYFVDFGNTDTILKTDIKGLAKQFKQQPMYAIRCALEGIDPNQIEEIQDKFTELVQVDMDGAIDGSEKPLRATFIRQEKGSYLVSLYDGHVPLIQVGVPQISTKKPIVKAEPKIEPESKLPPHWRRAKDGEGKTYFYHAITRKVQWNPPTLEDNTATRQQKVVRVLQQGCTSCLRRRLSAACSTVPQISTVSVPADFGIENLQSRVHGNITIKLKDASDMKANSLILSYNSSVFYNMFFNLEMLSVDIDDFNVTSVRLFVEALYTGKIDLNRQLFRDINKISHVFKVTWLMTKCDIYFGDLVEDLKNTGFEETLFLFEEAYFAKNVLKNDSYIETFLSKISTTPDTAKTFIERYMNMDYINLSTNHLDIMIQIAHADSHIQVLTKLIKDNIVAQGLTLDDNSKYLLLKMNLVNLIEQNKSLFEEFFDFLLEDVKNISVEDIRMITKLNRDATKEYQNIVGS